MNNKYALFYKTNENSHWQSKRLDLPIEEWENYAKEQGYYEYEIKNLEEYEAYMMHLVTDVVLFDNKYYLPDENIPYLNKESTYPISFDISFEQMEEDENDVEKYKEIYDGIEKIWTNIITYIHIDNDVHEFSIDAQDFIKRFPVFLEKLEKENHSVYINDEFSNFKWLAWEKDNKIRLINQDYTEMYVENTFDISLDKELFIQNCKNMIEKMKEYADSDQKLYEQYVKENYGETNEQK